MIAKPISKLAIWAMEKWLDRQIWKDIRREQIESRKIAMLFQASVRRQQAKPNTRKPQPSTNQHN